jgi:hypothetical protein
MIGEMQQHEREHDEAARQSQWLQARIGERIEHRRPAVGVIRSER